MSTPSFKPTFKASTPPANLAAWALFALPLSKAGKQWMALPGKGAGHRHAGCSGEHRPSHEMGTSSEQR